MKKTAKASLYITHLKLENWRNFTRVGIDLRRRVFLVGPNASGKTNLPGVRAMEMLEMGMGWGWVTECPWRKRLGREV